MISRNPPKEVFSSTHGLLILGLLQVAVARDTKYSFEFASQIPGRSESISQFGVEVYRIYSIKRRPR